MLLVFLLFLFLFLLTRSEAAVQYASEGLLLWFGHMIPALFPCIVWSDIMIETDSAGHLTRWFYPILHRILGLSAQGAFVFLIGFTGGFPLGAKLSADLYRRGRISLQEADFLLSFCNNLGPVYLLGCLFPMLGISRRGLCLAILYGVPMAYGLFRHCFVCRGSRFETADAGAANARHSHTDLLSAVDGALHNGVNAIVMLGAYVVFFQTLRLFYLPLPEKIGRIAALFTEINSGVGGLEASGFREDTILWIFCGVTLGGLCCVAQTAHVLQGTGLSVRKYVLHKVIQTALVFCAFFVCLKLLHISL